MRIARDRLTELRRNDGGMTPKTRMKNPGLPHALTIRRQQPFRFALRHEGRNELSRRPAPALHHIADQQPVAVIVAGTGRIEVGIAGLQTLDETFDIGIDTRTSVNDKDYQVPFAFNGTINKLTFKLGPMQLTGEEQAAAGKAIARAKD